MATVILQARSGSTRLPGKALMKVLGRPMVWYSVATLRQAPGVSRIVMAIPDNSRDDILAEYAAEWGVFCFRGSEEDVLSRFQGAARAFPDQFYFRATGDNPILDIANPGRLLAVLQETGCDYAAERGLPLGSAVEGFTAEALERCHVQAVAPEDREHVTLFMKRPENGVHFRPRFPPAPPEYTFPKLRLTVDYPEDFQRASEIITALYSGGVPEFSIILDYARTRGWLS